jgi:hypothetical protein
MAVSMFSTKRVAISKANAQIFAVVSVAAFLSVFCLVASGTVFGQIRYNAKLTKEKEKANTQLDQNLDAYEDLLSSYQQFDRASTNIIDGNKNGNGDNDGPNSKIILDALPAVYDFPALASSIEKVLNDQGVKVIKVEGTDDEVNQQGNTSSSSPTAVEMPFSFTVETDYSGAQRVVSSIQRSIRPVKVVKLDLSGASSKMTIKIDAVTYFQPGKTVNITTKVVK